MKLLQTHTLIRTAQIDEADLRRQLGDEFLGMVDMLDGDGKRLPGVTVRVLRRGGRQGGYKIEAIRDLTKMTSIEDKR